MNERIRELVEQAGGNFGQGLEFAVVFGESEDFEKFAELIVKECIGVIEEVGNQHRVGDQVTESDVCGHKIKQHFGVEE